MFTFFTYIILILSLSIDTLLTSFIFNTYNIKINNFYIIICCFINTLFLVIGYLFSNLLFIYIDKVFIKFLISIPFIILGFIKLKNNNNFNIINFTNIKKITIKDLIILSVSLSLDNLIVGASLTINNSYIGLVFILNFIINFILFKVNDYILNKLTNRYILNYLSGILLIIIGIYYILM